MATDNRTNDGAEILREEDMVSLQSLSNLTGFPTELIKKELLVNEGNTEVKDEVSLGELRELMAELIDKTFNEEPSNLQ